MENSHFTDVGRGYFPYNYFRFTDWAHNNNIVNGVGNNMFNPGHPVTREQAAVFFYTYTRFRAQTDSDMRALLDEVFAPPFNARALLRSEFPDEYRDVSPWAERGLAFAVAVGLFRGRGTPHGVRLEPRASITRAEGASLISLYRRHFMHSTFIVSRDGWDHDLHPRGFDMLSFDLGGTDSYPTYPAAVRPTPVLIADYLNDFLWWHRGGDLYDGPERHAHTFTGWYLDSNFTIPLTDDTKMPHTELTLYARWSHDYLNEAPVYIGHLQAAIAAAESRQQQSYTQYSWANLQAKLTAARAILETHSVMQRQVDAAYNALWVAIEALESAYSVYFGELGTAIQMAELRNQHSYTPESWANLQYHLASARAVFSNQHSTYYQVNTASANLFGAIEALEPDNYLNQPPVNTWYLAQAITEAESRQQQNYTQDSWANLQANLTAARAVLEAVLLTQAQVNTATNNLQGALQSLEIANNQPTPIHTGRVSTTPWNLYADGTLHVQGGTINWNAGSSPWLSHSANIRNIVFNAPIDAGPEMRNLFRDLTNLETISGLENINTTGATNMTAMFFGATNLTSVYGLANWDTSNVTRMDFMFRDARSLAHGVDISGWDVGRVVTMERMFINASALPSLDLSNWNTQSVTDMDQMFRGTTSLVTVGDLSNWDTANVRYMSSMFFNASALATLDLSGWDVGNVTTMNHMFRDAGALVSVGNLSGWDTGSVTTMDRMFFNAASLVALDLAGWNVSNVTDMNQLFRGAARLVTVGDLSGWDTAKVGYMTGMFRYTHALMSLDLSGWDVGNISDMSDMFTDSGIQAIGNVSNWDTSNVTTMTRMFFGASALTSLDLSGWDVGNVATMNLMFRGASELSSLDMGGWDMTAAINTQQMFMGATALRELTLGSGFRANVAGTSSLPAVPGGGRWQNVGAGTVDSPLGEYLLTSLELMDMYSGGGFADVWVR